MTYPPTCCRASALWCGDPVTSPPRRPSRFIDVAPEALSRPSTSKTTSATSSGRSPPPTATARSVSSSGARSIPMCSWSTSRPPTRSLTCSDTCSASRGCRGARGSRRFGRAVEEIYLYADRLVGEYMEAMDDDTTLVVLSDHGFQLGVLQDDPSKTRDLRRVSERFHRDEGILYLYGRGVARRRLDAPTILDVAPTILALAGLPAASDMPGRILAEGLDAPFPTDRVASYESGAGDGTGQTARDTSADPQIVERLKSLGYLGGSEGDEGAGAQGSAGLRLRPG